MPVGVAAGGMIKAHKELYSPKNRKTEKMGTMMTSSGNMMVDSINNMMTFSPLKRNLDSAYPAMVLMMTAMIVLDIATKKVLNIYNEKLPLLSAMVKLSKVQFLGINVGVEVNSSDDGLKAEKMM
jgi:hypothetical protein